MRPSAPACETGVVQRIPSFCAARAASERRRWPRTSACRPSRTATACASARWPACSPICSGATRCRPSNALAPLRAAEGFDPLRDWLPRRATAERPTFCTTSSVAAMRCGPSSLRRTCHFGSGARCFLEPPAWRRSSTASSSTATSSTSTPSLGVREPP